MWFDETTPRHFHDNGRMNLVQAEASDPFYKHGFTSQQG